MNIGDNRMKRSKFFVCFLVLLILQILIVDRVFARISIEIGRPGSVIFNIAVPDFFDLQRKGSGYEFGTNLRNIMVNDLEMSEIFNVMDKKVYIEKVEDIWKSQQINVKSWSTIGADLLLKVGYNLQGDKVEVVFSLIDVNRGDIILSKSGTSHINDSKYLIHSIVDEILKALTGEFGVFRTKIAFVSNHKGNKEIFMSDFSGDNLTTITNYGTISLLPKISPDGNGVLFVSYKDGNGPQLYYKDLKGGSIVCLSRGADSASGGTWMPDGKRVVASLTIKGNQDLFLLDLQGNLLRKLTDYPGIEVGPTVSPDGSRLAFVSDRDGSPQVYVMDIGGGGARKITFEGRYNSSPSWSSKNQIAYASLLDGKFDIVVTDPEGARHVRITGGGANHEDPSWAPNGRYLVYSSNKGGRYKLYFRGMNTQKEKMLVNIEGDQLMPFWFK